MGVVHLARDERLGRLVALKLLRPGEFLHGDAPRRFQREAEAAARLSHPNIVPVHAYGEEDGVPYLAMEYVRGTSLDRVLERVAEVDGAGRFTVYEGNYDRYLSQRDEQREQLLARKANQDREIAQMERFVERFFDGRGGAPVSSAYAITDRPRVG